MHLTFQVPIQYCSLQPWTSLLSQVTSTTGHCSHFCSASSFFSGAFSPLFFSSILGTYWLGGITSFCLFILFMGFSRGEYWSSLPFPSPVDHVLLELSTMTLPFWVALHGMTHSFTELDKAVCDQWSVWLIFCSCGSHSVCPLMDKDKRLLEASWWEGLAVGASRSWADGWSHSQSILNPIFCFWMWLCSLPVVSPEAKLW